MSFPREWALSARIELKEDSDSVEWDLETAIASSDADPMEQFDPHARDLKCIVPRIVPAGQFLRYLVVQVHHVHFSRWIFEMQSRSRGG